MAEAFDYTLAALSQNKRNQTAQVSAARHTNNVGTMRDAGLTGGAAAIGTSLASQGSYNYELAIEHLNLQNQLATQTQEQFDAGATVRDALLLQSNVGALSEDSFNITRTVFEQRNPGILIDWDGMYNSFLSGNLFTESSLASYNFRKNNEGLKKAQLTYEAEQAAASAGTE